MVLDHLGLLGDPFYLEFQVDQVALVHPMDRNRKVILTLKPKKILDFKWNSNIGLFIGIEQGTGEIKFCMNILPTNIFHISNIWLLYIRSIAVGKENSRDCSLKCGKRRQGDSYKTRRIVGLQRECWGRGVCVCGCVYVIKLVFYLNCYYFSVFSLPYIDFSYLIPEMEKSPEVWTLVFATITV